MTPVVSGKISHPSWIPTMSFFIKGSNNSGSDFFLAPLDANSHHPHFAHNWGSMSVIPGKSRVIMK